MVLPSTYCEIGFGSVYRDFNMIESNKSIIFTLKYLFEINEEAIEKSKGCALCTPSHYFDSDFGCVGDVTWKLLTKNFHIKISIKQ